jgi:hypothetical protein
LVKHNNIKHLDICKSISMPPKKSTETNATAKGQAAEKTDTSKMPPKKEANNNDNDKPIVKPRSRRDTKPAVKMESADEDAEDAADEGTPGPETPKRGPGRPPKKHVQGTTPKRGPSRPPKTGAANKGKISQAFKETGGWVYAGEDVTADESTVVDKDENGNGRFPWASIITMK